ncbi:META domain-containing protein [Hugenholtzia roseola]|uniref:META domain-containing protein n=1 Tax=Hugenholtzia roseola TaxID=1002 RepID=UPI000400B60C|nr:META domain-containing protein [Hugenholtzia roseola]
MINKSKIAIPFLFWILLLLTASCAGSKKKQSKIAPQPFMETMWKITYLEGVETLPSSAKKDIFVLFQDDAKSLRGFAGCNNFSGMYQIDQTAKKLSISGFMATKMSCPLLKFEYDYLGKLEKATRYEIEGKKLSLYQDALLLATFEAQAGVQ